MNETRIGVCSWSLQPTGPTDLIEKVEATGVRAIQLALDPIRRGSAEDWDETRTVRLLKEAGIQILSGMMGMEGEDYSSLDRICATGGVRLDATWDANLSAARANAELAARLGLELVTFHAGFIPHDAGAERDVMIERLRAIVDCFAASGVQVGFETGQETAATLLDALEELDRPMVGVNFDPANMILYGMGDPVSALRDLAERVVQIHIKDALPTQTPGTWGAEEAAGAGSVRWSDFFKVIQETGLAVDLVIEREAGDDRIGDVRSAVDLIRRITD